MAIDEIIDEIKPNHYLIIKNYQNKNQKPIINCKIKRTPEEWKELVSKARENEYNWRRFSNIHPGQISYLDVNLIY